MLLAIYLLSLATLLFQFVQTRMFSATLDYHLTFLVVSGALLGVAAGGTAAAVVDHRPRRPSSAALALGAAFATVLALSLETRVDPIGAGAFTSAGLAYVAGVPPVLCASWVIVRALRESPSMGGILYAADLAGAASGGALGYAAIGTLGAQGLYGVVAAASLLSAAALASSQRRPIIVRLGLAALAAATIAVLAVWGEEIAPPRPGPFKVTELAMPHEYARWDPLARIDVNRIGTSGSPAHYAFLIDDRYTGPRPPSLQMTLDMGAQTPIVEWDRRTDLAVLDASILAAPYRIAPRTSVLVVGPGGGIDILTALHNGVASVEAVEVNRAEVAVMRGRYAAYSGDLYLDARVHVVEDEARSFIRRSSDRYDVIPITVVDSFAALSVGAYALTENYLYTEGAMVDYLEHLSPGGVVAISRWYSEGEIHRTVALARAALLRLGDGTSRSIAVLRHRDLGLVLVRSGPFTQGEVGSLRSFAATHGFAVTLDPFSSVSEFDVAPAGAPPTDDHPFFFDTVPLSEVIDGRAPLPYGYIVLAATLVLSLALSVSLAMLPIYRNARLAAGSPVPTGTVVALALGAGFIAAELVLLQRLTLYLGQPSLALSIGLAALLGGAATGSVVSARFRSGLRVRAVASAVVLLVTLGGLPTAADATLAASLEVRIAVSIAAAWTVGLPLGTMFPRLIARVSDPALVSWIWAANGSASVVGAIVGTVIALAGGFSTLGVFAAACYAAAALFSPAE